MDISPIDCNAIYRTRLAGPNILQYIESAQETEIEMIFVHCVATCNLQHITLHDKKREKSEYNISGLAALARQLIF